MANDYLKLKDNTWTVVVEVPKHLRRPGEVPARFKQSLKTTNLAEANRLKHPYVAEFLRRIETLKLQQTDPKAAVIQDAKEWREALANSTRSVVEQEGREHVPYDELLSAVKDLARQLAEKDAALAEGFYKTATGEGSLLKDLYPTWLTETTGTGQTSSQHGSATRRFLAWAGELVTVEEVTRKKAGEYVSDLLANSGLARRTIKRHLSSLSNLWQWLEAKGYEVENRWLGHKLGKKPKGAFRMPLADELVLRMLKGSYSRATYRQTLHDLLRLALFTGERLDELCAIKRKDVHKREDGYWFTIVDGKSDAALREVPVHRAIVPIVERRVADKDEFLFRGLTPGGPDGKRSWYVSKAYGRFRRNMGVSEPGQDFHALRNTFIDHMEGLDVPESTTKLLVGHKRESMTYGHYSKGQRVNLRTVIEKLTYSPAIMKAL